MSNKTIRAKFVCESVTENADGNKGVNLTAVTSGSEENKSFSKYTPAGNVYLNVSKETDAADTFKPGKEYYLDFTEAEPAV